MYFFLEPPLRQSTRCKVEYFCTCYNKQNHISNVVSKYQPLLFKSDPLMIPSLRLRDINSIQQFHFEGNDFTREYPLLGEEQDEWSTQHLSLSYHALGEYIL